MILYSQMLLLLLNTNKNLMDIKTYQLISDRIIILNSKADHIASILDENRSIEKKHGKSIEVAEELENEILLKEFIYDLNKLKQKEILIWEDSSKILDPTILLSKANKLADSPQHRDWTLLNNSLQDFVNFIHSKTTEDLSDQHAKLQEKWNKAEKKTLENMKAEVSESKVLDLRYNALDMKIADEFEENKNYIQLKVSLFKIACNKLEEAVNTQKESNDPVLKDLGATGEKSLNLARRYIEKHKIDGIYLDKYTNWVNKISQVVAKPSAHGQTFTEEEMKLGNDSRAADIFLGLTCITLGLATIAASIAFAVLTCGVGSGLSIGGFAIGSSLATTGAVMLDLKQLRLIGSCRCCRWRSECSIGTSLTFFDNKGRFGLARMI